MCIVCYYYYTIYISLIVVVEPRIMHAYKKKKMVADVMLLKLEHHLNFVLKPKREKRSIAYADN